MSEEEDNVIKIQLISFFEFELVDKVVYERMLYIF